MQCAKFYRERKQQMTRPQSFKNRKPKPRRLMFEPLESRRVLAATFSGLGDLPGGSFYSEANDVSADGRTVVGASVSSNGGEEAYSWTADSGMIGLEIPDGFTASVANGVSGDGSVIVGTSEVSQPWHRQAIRWTNTLPGLLGNLPADVVDSAATAVSADGSTVVGGVAYPNTRTGYIPGREVIWNNEGVLTDLGVPPSLANGSTIDYPANTYPGAASSDGSVIVGTGFAPATIGYEPVRWTADGIVGLEVPPDAYNMTATGVSADGTVIVGHGSFSSTNELVDAFRWTASNGFVPLGTLPDDAIGFSSANDVSADGSVIVGYAGLFPQSAVIWTATKGIQSVQQLLTDAGVNLQGWLLTNATGVSADGTIIVGNGIDPAGFGEGWIVRLASPDLVGSIEYGDLNSQLHQQIYEGQELKTTLTVKNQGEAIAEGDVVIRYYLSTDQKQSISNEDKLVGETVETLSLAPGGTTAVDHTLTLHDPIPEGAYFLKISIDEPPSEGESGAIGESNEDNNIEVSDEVHSCGIPFGSGKASSAQRTSQYESAVEIAKASPAFSIVDGTAYTKQNEGFREYPYLDTREIATIGWGTALQTTKDGNATQLAKIRVNQAHLEFPKGSLTAEQISQLNSIGIKVKAGHDFQLDVNDLIAMAKNRLRIAIPGISSVADQWFNEDYRKAQQDVISSLGLDASELDGNPNVLVVLVDMRYNLGLQGLLGFNSFLSKLREGLTTTGDAKGIGIACAAFHMMNSDWSVQVGKRAISGFRLLVSGFERYL
jgi:uncharacterized membrane protein